MMNTNKINVNLIQDSLDRKYCLYPKSLWYKDNCAFFLVKNLDVKYLGIAGNIKDIEHYGFIGIIGKNIILNNTNKIIRLYQKNEENLKKLTSIFPSLKPSPLGHKASFGFGDRLGIATPAHIKVLNKQKNILPVFAQQSVRELNKTNRTFQDIIVSAMWGIFQEGYTGKWGADADHIKSKECFASAADQGMTMFTLDGSDFLEEGITNLNSNQIQNKFNLNSKYLRNIIDRYVGKIYKIGDFVLNFNEDKTISIALVYGKILSFAQEMFQFLKDKINNFDYEISLDETSIVTLPEAHYLIANEMRLKGINFSSLALKFPGTFEKGIDYRGDILEFEKKLKIHCEISRRIGGYKLSLHSGSDKFTIYPVFNKHTEGLFHIKTSGTSWLEALALIADRNPGMFKDLFYIAVDTFKENKRDYNVNISYNDLPKNINNICDEKLKYILYDDIFRRIFHIAYGPILKRKKKDLLKIILNNEEKYYQFLINHLERHFDALNK